METTISDIIQVRAVETDEELRLANDLMAKTYTKGPSESMEWIPSYNAIYPGFQKEHTRVAIFEDQIAGALRLTTETLRIGEARLKTGGLSMISTAPHLQHEHISEALIEDSLRYMNDHRYDLSMTFGHGKLSRQFGYESILSDYIIQVETDEAFKVARYPSHIYRMRNAKPGDIPAIQKIHQQDDARVSCSLLRSKAHITNKWNRYEGLKVCINNSGKVVGYVWLNQGKNTTTILEIGGETHEIFPELLAYCTYMAHEEFCPTLQFHLPPDHPFSAYLGMIASSKSITLNTPTPGHMKFMDIAEALEHMIPEWESRISATLLQELRCEVTMIVGRDTYRIRSNRGAVDIAFTMGQNKYSSPASEFLNLVTGKISIEASYNRIPRLINIQGKALLQALFPKRYPYVYMFDRF